MTDKQTLPRRSLFRPAEPKAIYKNGKLQPPKAKRYGKSAKKR